MEKKEFIDILDDYLEETGMSQGAYNCWFSVGDERNVNTNVYLDEDGFIWVAGNESVKRVKTSINVEDVVELRFSEFGSDSGRFFIICNDYSGLDFCEGSIGFFEDGYYGHFKDAVEWFTEHPFD